MVTITLPDALAERLTETAHTRQQSLEELLADLLDNTPTPNNRFDHIIGAFDDDISDLSTTVRETLRNHFAAK